MLDMFGLETDIIIQRYDLSSCCFYFCFFSIKVFYKEKHATAGEDEEQKKKNKISYHKGIFR